jgi:hypothetical protein
LQRLAEHYRKLAAEEVAMAKVALTNEARARHYAKAANYWKLADAAAIRLRVKPRATAAASAWTCAQKEKAGMPSNWQGRPAWEQ